MIKTLLGILGLLTLPGCVSFSYDLTTPAAAPASTPTRTGRDCGVVLFGLGFGDLSVADAMKQGHVLKPSKITLSQTYVLFAGQNCVTVEGEADPTDRNIPAIVEPETGTGYEYRQRK